VSCRVGLNGSTTGPDWAELNESCRARPTSYRPGPSTTAQLILWAGLGPLPIVTGRAHTESNYTGRGPTHLLQAKFSGLTRPHVCGARAGQQVSLRCRCWVEIQSDPTLITTVANNGMLGRSWTTVTSRSCIFTNRLVQYKSVYRCTYIRRGPKLNGHLSVHLDVEGWNKRLRAPYSTGLGCPYDLTFTY
jgi:hypothetical protein